MSLLAPVPVEEVPYATVDIDVPPGGENPVASQDQQHQVAEQLMERGAQERAAPVEEPESHRDKEERGAVRLMLAYLSKLPGAPEDVLRVFNRGRFFTCIGNDAHTVAKHYFKSAVRFVGLGNEKYPYISFDVDMCEKIMNTSVGERFVHEQGDWTLEMRFPSRSAF